MSEVVHNFNKFAEVIDLINKICYFEIDYKSKDKFTLIDLYYKDIKEQEFNIPLFGDTAQVNLNAFVLNKTPNYYMRHYHSKHAWWDYDDFDKEMKTRIEGTINIPHTKTKVYVGIENIKNYMYFQNTGEAYTLPDNTYTISNNITPMQTNKNIQVFCANLKQDFKFGILHIELRFMVSTWRTLAKCSGAKVGIPSYTTLSLGMHTVSPIENIPGSNTPMISPA